jgi:predicted HTH domain antitoxin
MAFVLSDEERAAAIAGLHQMDFQRQLAQRKIPLHYDLEMLEEDLQHAAGLKPL